MLAQSQPEPPQLMAAVSPIGCALRTAGACGTASDEGGNRRLIAVGRGQCLVHAVFHHGRGREVAVMTTEAGEHAGDIWRVSQHAGGENFNELAAAGGDGFSVEAADIFTPEDWATSGGGVKSTRLAVAGGSAVR